MFIDDNGLHVYECKDGRLRAYSPISKKIISYPRVMMDKVLNRPLNEYEEVHHKDENPYNNDVSNLIVMSRKEHKQKHNKKYYDIIAKCPECNNLFIWKAKQQMMHYGNANRKNRNGRMGNGPFCSKHCSGVFTRRIQLQNIANDK